MKLSRYLIIGLLLASCTSTAETFSPDDFIGVTCSSRDGGKSCFGYGEVYDNGLSDACGRLPNGGPEFAMKLKYEVTGNMRCETVVATSDPKTMPVGERLCMVYTAKEPNALVYRFTDDDPARERRSYRAQRSDKWCQHLIDAL